MREEELIIAPGRTEKNYWRDIYRYKELFLVLSWRDFKVRYKQASFGVLWSVIRPILTMMVFLFLQRMANFEFNSSAPYAIFFYSGLLGWQFFAGVLGESSGSLVANSALISKVYFPRIIITGSSFFTLLIDFLISLGILFCVMLYYQYIPSWRMIFIPIFLIHAGLTALSFGIILTAMNVKYRDFKFVIPFIIQFGFFISPIIFSVEKLVGWEQIAYSLNPMVGVIEGFKWAILKDGHLSLGVGYFISIAITFILLFLGISYFRKVEKTFADFI
jgi:lipopolysaccharide transport system permease protein